jgi:hypothetical protein
LLLTALWRETFTHLGPPTEFQSGQSLPAELYLVHKEVYVMLVLKLRRSHFSLILLIVSLSLVMVSANILLAQSPNRNDLNDAEKIIWDMVSAGKPADVKGKNGEKPQITSHFIENLLTGKYQDFKIQRRGVIINNAVITGSLDLINAEIPFDVDLSLCIFRGKVDFSKSRFQKDLFLVDCHFDQEAHFCRMQVEKGAYFRHSRFTKNVEIDRISIGESLNMESTIFEQAANFADIRIKGDGYLGNKVEFHGPLTFYRASVGGVLDFGREDQGATFSQGLDFSSIKVGSHLALRSAEIRGPAKFDGAFIGGDLKAQKAKFHDGCSFHSVKIGQAMNLTGVWFFGPVDFSEADIGRFFNLSDAQMLSKEPANFQDLKVGQWVKFKDITFKGPLDFAKANIGGLLLFELSNKEGDKIDGQPFQGTDAGKMLECKPPFLLNEAHFRELIIRGPIKDESRLQKEEGQGILAPGVINLEKTTVDHRFILEGIAIQALDAPQLQVKGLAAFDKVKITNKVDLQNSNFQSLQINKVLLPKEKESVKIDRLVVQDLSSLGYVNDFLELLNKSSFDKKSYLQLEDYLKRQNQNDLADDVFKYEQQREVEDSWKNWPFIKRSKYFYGWLTGYGRSNYRILVLSLFVILFGSLWFNPDYLQSGRALPQLKNRFLLRLLLSLDIFLPNVPQKVTDLTKFPRIELGLENAWEAPKNIKLLNAYVWVQKTTGWLLFLMLFPVGYQFVKKFLEG